MNAGRFASGVFGVLPDFFAGERKDRREQAGECEIQAVERGLTAAACFRSGAGGVERIFRDVEIDGAEFCDGEFVDGAVDLMERVFAIPVEALADEIFGFEKDPSIEAGEFFAGQDAGGRIETIDVAEHVAEGVAEFAIGFGETVGDGVGEANVFGEIDGGDPEAEQICTIFLDDFLGLDDVAERLGHGAAFGVEGPTVGDAFAVGR